MMNVEMIQFWRGYGRKIVCRLHNAILSAAEGVLPWMRPRECPCCGWTGLRFRSFAVMEYLRRNVICPQCGSFERHRALSFFYARFLAALGQRPSRLIHFSAESCLEKILMPLCDRYEKSSHGDEVTADLQLDLGNLKLGDETCDLLLMNHVLDCMSSDRGVAIEMNRVLRPGGVALAIVSIEEGVRTRELATPMSNSCYRIYGSEDLAERFAPLTVSVVNAAEGLSAEVRKRNGIHAFVSVLVLKKEMDSCRS